MPTKIDFKIKTERGACVKLLSFSGVAIITELGKFVAESWAKYEDASPG